MPEPTNPMQSDRQSAPQPDPNEKLVKVFDTEQETEAIVVQGLLESSGIDSDLKSIDAVQDAFPGVGGTVILVREEDEAEAKKIIDAYRNLPPTDDETADLAG
jgi:putative signal transducing protein